MTEDKIREEVVDQARLKRLEAAAPELYEALLLLVNELGIVPDEPTDFDAGPLWRAFANANTALRKAEGK